MSADAPSALIISSIVKARPEAPWDLSKCVKKCAREIQKLPVSIRFNPVMDAKIRR
ncbi:MAG: hypothetical protein RL695_1662 [Pseudomonadota bacterium]|jgi:arginine decarboxylase-like protein